MSQSMGAVSVDFYNDSEGFSFSVVIHTVVIHTGDGRAAGFDPVSSSDFTAAGFNAAWQAIKVADAFDLEEIAVRRYTREGQLVANVQTVPCPDLATSAWTLLADTVTEIAVKLRDNVTTEVPANN